MDWLTIGKWVASVVATIVAAGFVFRFVVVRKSSDGNRPVSQVNNRAGRDIIGGDKIDKR